MADEKSIVDTIISDIMISGNMKETLESRLLGPAESNMWFANRNVTLNICLASPLSGEPVEPEQFSAAVQAVCLKIPMLRCTIKTDPLRFNSESGSADIWYESGSLADRIDTHMNTRFHEEQGLCRFELLRQQDDSQAILLSFHHSIGDGISGSFVIKYLEQALNGKTFEQGSGLLPAWEDILSTSITGWLGFKGFAKTLGWIFRQLRPLGFSTPVVKLSDDKVTARTARNIAILLDPAQTQSLVDRSRNYGCTLHGLLTAYIAEALGPEMNTATGGWTFVSPVDMRKRLGQDSQGFEDALQFVNAAALTVVNPGRQTQQEMAVSASQQVRVFIEEGYSKFFAPYPSRLFMSRRLFPNNTTGIRRAGWYNRLILKKTSALISNLGVLGRTFQEQNSKVQLGRISVCSSPGIVTDLAHFAATHAGKLTMMVCYNSPQMSEARMAKYVERLRAALLDKPPATTS